MSKAQDTRFAALETVSQSVVSVERGTAVATWHITDRDEIAAKIRELSALGRTQRWADAIETWAVLVETEESLEWSFLQGSIWASHAA